MNIVPPLVLLAGREWASVGLDALKTDLPFDVVMDDAAPNPKGRGVLLIDTGMSEERLDRLCLALSRVAPWVIAVHGHRMEFYEAVPHD